MILLKKIQIKYLKNSLYEFKLEMKEETTVSNEDILKNLNLIYVNIEDFKIMNNDDFEGMNKNVRMESIFERKIEK